ncbi:methylated-DNA--[protein]-cysteine S-methyltransferase [Calidifontibacillus oryziterrae]|uniref:methylated-DNA--[protein]-cysteine S-methyltransferase n=1 Tax=Calidifontibacillus oryziterrae TaxID=1191699 RepID=UPI0002FC3F1E|nr:methylated-DNA--[protein]-cysteine S-methyltransferase [Calidifontibacillus oryziterrae]
MKPIYCYAEMESPIGTLTIATTNKGICSIEFGCFQDVQPSLISWLNKHFSTDEIINRNEMQNSDAKNDLKNRDEMSDRTIDELKNRDEMSGRTIDEIKNRDEMSGRTIDELKNRDGMSGRTIDELKNRDGMSGRTIHELTYHDNMLQLAIDELTEYFNGERERFTMELDLYGTPFQQKVWKELLKIKYGSTKSYKDISEAISSPKAARAVGSAIGRNPIPIVIPCHRVITSNGRLGGFSGGLDKKEKLLALENIPLNPMF